MASLLAWPSLFDRVAAMFVAESTPAVNLFGWRVPAQHAVSNRLAWVPGDPGGKFGPTGPPRNPGGYPRSLATTHELFSVYINAQDPSDPENERKQYELARYLRDAWYRAVYTHAYGAWRLVDEAWLIGRKERRYGAALCIVSELDATVPDLPFSQIPPWEDAPPDTEIAVDVTELDVTETLLVTPT
jgi:hypothetical protein